MLYDIHSETVHGTRSDTAKDDSYVVVPRPDAAYS